MRRVLLRHLRPAAAAAPRHVRSITTTSASATTTKPYYVSTPIFYVNAVPHIGHLYTSVVADVLTRYHSLKNPGSSVFLNTGTDEHGLKIQRAAQLAGREPKDFCDGISGRFKDLATAADVRYDRFMRTTDEDHLHAAQHFWRELVKSGAVYKGEHSGWYSVSDECFYTESQIKPLDRNSPNGTIVSIETGSTVEWTQEENYKFRLGQFREPLLKWLNENQNSVYPPNRKQELLEYLSDPSSMPDLSISRPRKRLQWGIPVPDDDNHTIYVWLEALVNYLTAVGYPWKDGRGDGKGWPTDVHVVGKDITRFHAVLFPSFLLALNLPLPRTILTHGHWTVSHFKMSKSLGNVADPFTSLSTYGPDAVRFFLMRIGGNFRNDSDWSERQLEVVYEKELKNVLGNLLSRVCAPRLGKTLGRAEGFVRAMDGETRASLEYSSLLRDESRRFEGEDGRLKASLSTLRADVEGHMETFEFARALERIQEALNLANEHTNKLSWWHLSSLPTLSTSSPSSSSSSPSSALVNDIATLRRTHLYMHETLRLAGILLQPFMPRKSAQMLQALGVSSDAGGDWASAVLGGEAFVDGDGGEMGIEAEMGRYSSKNALLFPNLSAVERRAKD